MSEVKTEEEILEIDEELLTATENYNVVRRLSNDIIRLCEDRLTYTLESDSSNEFFNMAVNANLSRINFNRDDSISTESVIGDFLSFVWHGMVDMITGIFKWIVEKLKAIWNFFSGNKQKQTDFFRVSEKASSSLRTNKKVKDQLITILETYDIRARRRHPNMSFGKGYVILPEDEKSFKRAIRDLPEEVKERIEKNTRFVLASIEAYGDPTSFYRSTIDGTAPSLKPPKEKRFTKLEVDKVTTLLKDVEYIKLPGLKKIVKLGARIKSGNLVDHDDIIKVMKYQARISNSLPDLYKAFTDLNKAVMDSVYSILDKLPKREGEIHGYDWSVMFKLGVKPSLDKFVNEYNKIDPVISTEGPNGDVIISKKRLKVTEESILDIRVEDEQYFTANGNLDSLCTYTTLDGRSMKNMASSSISLLNSLDGLNTITINIESDSKKMKKSINIYNGFKLENPDLIKNKILLPLTKVAFNQITGPALTHISDLISRLSPHVSLTISNKLIRATRSIYQ